ncbi:MAG: PASTA domain-containing protein [Ignavibacteria bacterium]|nr:PASTA domain-containing protein [Ignavibacteria bacterium]MBT8381856.1 PASTA domain-containing protein [Ignavibacteria bacterium]MBT8390298.1 PASTA domain-containing protein [Ignavibacteria bacterium]NNJ53065.1 PASTA domain-containing protein [Ignavibacteriaceae bacterium]NNL20269.1 PASTA domain-containing protein [Ignavibacteriaceae bacterium]
MKNPLRFKLFRILLYILLGAAAVIFLLDNLIMPWYVSSPETTVSSVINMKESDAIATLEQTGFEVVVSDTSFGLENPAGTIFLQTPEAGKVVKEGRTIYLFVSGGEKVLNVPELKGKSIVDAKFALERIGLKLGRVQRLSSSQPEDMIIDQEYAVNTPLKNGESVGVIVSAGRGRGSIVVPDLIGKSLLDARLILSDSSLVVGKVNEQPSATLLPNTVLDQYPSSGNKVNPGDAVDLFVTKPTNQNVPLDGGNN